MKNILLLLIAAALAVPAFAGKSWDAAMEVQRIKKELQNERKQPQSGNLASLKWQLAANQRILELLEVYRTEAVWKIDQKWYETNVSAATNLIELYKQGIAREEAHIKRTGQESQQPCEYFFTPETKEDSVVLFYSARSCIIDMPYKYPAAWARLKGAIPLVEFSRDAPPAREAIYRAFVESGVVTPPPAPQKAPPIEQSPVVVAAAETPTPARKTSLPSEAELRRFMQPQNAAPAASNPPESSSAATPRLSEAAPLLAPQTQSVLPAPSPPAAVTAKETQPPRQAQSAPKPDQSPVSRVVSGVSNIIKLLLAGAVLLVLAGPLWLLATQLKPILISALALYLRLMALGFRLLSKDSPVRKRAIRLLDGLLARLHPGNVREGRSEDRGGDAG